MKRVANLYKYKIMFKITCYVRLYVLLHMYFISVNIEDQILMCGTENFSTHFVNKKFITFLKRQCKYKLTMGRLLLIMSRCVSVYCLSRHANPIFSAPYCIVMCGLSGTTCFTRCLIRTLFSKKIIKYNRCFDFA